MHAQRAAQPLRITNARNRQVLGLSVVLLDRAIQKIQLQAQLGVTMPAAHLPASPGTPAPAPAAAPPAPPPTPVTGSLKDIGRMAAREAERELIYRTLQQTRWNRREAAEILGISYKALLYKIKEAELDKAS